MLFLIKILKLKCRNLTIKLADEYSLWTTGPGSDHFTVSATLRYPEQSLSYRPGFWQVIKWGWVQYVSLLLVFIYVTAAIKNFVFANQIVPTLVSLDQKH